MIRALVIVSVVLVALGCSAFGTLLSRIDLAHAESARAYAHTAILEARLVQFTHRDVKPSNDSRVDVCIARTDALRSAIKALVRLERVAMPNDPGWAWITWDEKLAVRR